MKRVLLVLLQAFLEEFLGFRFQRLALRGVDAVAKSREQREIERKTLPSAVLTVVHRQKYVSNINNFISLSVNRIIQMLR